VIDRLDHRQVRLLDVLVAVWVVAWVVAGLWVAAEVRGLTGLADASEASGRAVERTGAVLESISGLPLVTDDLQEAAGAVREAGTRVGQESAVARGHARTLSVLLALAVALIPVVPVAGVYVPARVRRARDVRALRRAVAAGADDPALVALLAARARVALPAARALEAGGTDDGAAERALARREMTRMGISGSARTDR